MAGLEIAWEILLWLLIGLGVTFLVAVWACIIFASVTTTFRFIQHYKKTAKEVEEAEKPKPEDPNLYY